MRGRDSPKIWVFLILWRQLHSNTSARLRKKHLHWVFTRIVKEQSQPNFCSQHESSCECFSFEGCISCKFICSLFGSSKLWDSLGKGYGRSSQNKGKVWGWVEGKADLAEWQASGVIEVKWWKNNIEVIFFKGIKGNSNSKTWSGDSWDWEGNNYAIRIQQSCDNNIRSGWAADIQEEQASPVLSDDVLDFWKLDQIYGCLWRVHEEHSPGSQ